MSPAPRKPAPTVQPPAATEGVNFGDLGLYAGGFTLPEGKYAVEWVVQMYAGFQGKNAPRLGVMGNFHPLDGGEAKPIFFSMGSTADKSFAPDSETGKSLQAIPGAPATTFNDKTNWALMLRSLYDCGLTPGVFTNDLSVLDGVWIQTQNVPEPEDRKGFGSRAQTGEAGEVKDERRGNQLTTICVEILEGGKPWEGGGGIPEAGAAPAPVKPGPKGVVKPVAARPAARPAPAPVAPVAEAADDDTMMAAVNGISAFLEKNPNGGSKLLLRTSTFKAVTEQAGAEMAQAVQNAYFQNDETLGSLLGELGFTIVGLQVKPAS